MNVRSPQHINFVNLCKINVKKFPMLTVAIKFYRLQNEHESLSLHLAPKNILVDG